MTNARETIINMLPNFDALMKMAFFGGIGTQRLSSALRYLALSRMGLSGYTGIYIGEYPDGLIVREAMKFDFDERQWHSIFKGEVPRDTFERYLAQVSTMDLMSLTRPNDAVMIAWNSRDIIAVKRFPSQPRESYRIEPWALAVCSWYDELENIFLDYPGGEDFYDLND